ncbi:MAG: hypothetical protein LC098_03335 [Burkholderiales bacterium]|nr:hypothetical protein [Burkholderiales bacterium]
MKAERLGDGARDGALAGSDGAVDGDDRDIHELTTSIGEPHPQRASMAIFVKVDF